MTYPKTDPMRSQVVVGAIAQSGERLVCNQEVAGSIPAGSTDVSPRSATTYAADPPSSRPPTATVSAMVRPIFGCPEPLRPAQLPRLAHDG